jgi:hypothetical protein
VCTKRGKAPETIFHDPTGPEKSGDGFLAVDVTGVIDIRIVVRLNTEAAAGIVDIRVPIAVRDTFGFYAPEGAFRHLGGLVR